MSDTTAPPPPPGGSPYGQGNAGSTGGYGQPGGYGGATPPPAPDFSQGGYGAAPGGPYGQPVGNSMKALWSMILGIISIPAACIPYLGIPLGIVGIILSRLGMKDIVASGGRQGGAGQAKAGLICSIVGLVLGLVIIILAIIGIKYGNTLNNYSNTH